MNCELCGLPLDKYDLCFQCESQQWDQTERFGHPHHGPFTVELKGVIYTCGNCGNPVHEDYLCDCYQEIEQGIIEQLAHFGRTMEVTK